MWMYLGLLAALFLGLHSLCKKHAVQGNEVFPVLLGTVFSGFLFVAVFYIISMLYPDYAAANGYDFQRISAKDHGFICFKSMLMAGSWILAYQALKHLPITIVTPIRSAGPFFTFIGAIVIYKESPNFWQWIGFFLIIFSVILYSRIGKKEGLDFKTNKNFYMNQVQKKACISNSMQTPFLTSKFQTPPRYKFILVAFF